MAFEIVNYGHPVLREVGKRVEDFSDDVRDFAAEMLETMYAAQGVGLAAQQVARAIQLCVVDVPTELDLDEETEAPMNPDVAMPLVLVNPTLSDASGKASGIEGCLSFPEIQLTVERQTELVVTYQSLDGESHTMTVRGFLARAIQHEVDHLNGKLFIDRVPEIRKIGVSGKIKRLRKETERLLAEA